MVSYVLYIMVSHLKVENVQSENLQVKTYLLVQYKV